jgi:hypothetical protein
MIQQYHSWAYIWRNVLQDMIESLAHLLFIAVLFTMHHLQLMNGLRKYGITVGGNAN